MEHITSAASLVSAALETAGYITQGEFLTVFKPFLETTGAFIYLLLCVGALTSTAIFGAYKTWRHMVVGPGIFFFLICWTETTDPVVWKMGSNGDIRTRNGITDEKQGKAGINAIVRDDTPSNLIKAQTNKAEKADEIVVSGVFRTYTRIINQLTQDFVSLILDLRDDKAMLSIGRAQMMEKIMGAQSLTPQFNNIMLDGLMKSCSEYVASSLTSSDSSSSSSTTKSATAASSTTDSSSSNTRVTPNKDTVDYIKKNFNALKNVFSGNTQLNSATSDSIGSLQNYTLSCEEMWGVARHALVTREGPKLAKEYLTGIIPPNVKDKSDAKNYLCDAVVEKLGDADFKGVMPEGGTTTSCDNLVSIAIIRNMVIGNSQSLVINDLKNRMQLLASEQPFKFMSTWKDSSGVVRTSEVANEADWTYMPEAGTQKIQVQINGVPGFSEDREETGFRGQFRNKNGETREFSAIGRGTIEKVNGQLSTAYNIQQYLTARNLRSQVLNFAMLLPYFQGVLLFFLGMAYPFVCLAVLMPNRAQNVLLMPLAWMWVKSWDIGFAAVSLFDDVLWNILPKTDVVGKMASKSFEQLKLGDILIEALKVDPSYHLHAYYMMTAMAVFAIPGISGAVIMKGKQSILSAFVKAPQSAAKEISGLVDKAAGQNQNTRFVAARRNMEDLAYLKYSDQGAYKMWANSLNKDLANYGFILGGAAGGNNGVIAGAFGAVKNAFSKPKSPGDTLDSLSSGKVGTGARKAVTDGALRSVASLPAQAKDLIEKQLNADAAYDHNFGTAYGRYGRWSMMNESSANAMDGAKFEIADIMGDKGPISRALAPQVELFLKKFGVIEGLVSTAVSQGAGTVAAKMPMTSAVLGGVAVVGVAESQAGESNKLRDLIRLCGGDNSAIGSVISGNTITNIDASDESFSVTRPGYASDGYNTDEVSPGTNPDTQDIHAHNIITGRSAYGEK